MIEMALNAEIDLASIGKKGMQTKLVATEEVLEQLAKACGIVSVRAFSGEMTIKPWRRTGYSLTGSIRAEVVQTCVVTLDPVSGVVEEDFKLKFLPAEEIEEPVFEPGVEVEFAFEAPDPPEPLESGPLGLFGIMVEQLTLGLEPYPRADGASWAGDGEQETPDILAEEHPFAALGGLKDGKKP